MELFIHDAININFASASCDMMQLYIQKNNLATIVRIM